MTVTQSTGTLGRPNAAVLIQGYAEDRGNPQLVPFGRFV
jgi:hypothetical protein